MNYEFSDRYGGIYPDVNTVCKGDCEGMGVVPVKKGEWGYTQAWEDAEAKAPSDDGFHFVKCKDCGGTGKQ